MKKIGMWLLALLSSYNAGAQPTVKIPSPGGNFPLKQVKNMPSNFYLTELPNGLEVLVIEDATVPLVTIELVVKNGAFVQTPELEGLAHLYEHMFFKANRDYKSQEAYLERVNELGIVFNGTTSDERVNYYVTLNKSKLTDGLQFMNSATRYPSFLKEEMEKENVVVAGEFQRNESNPTFFLFQDMGRRMWGKDFSRKNTIGEYPVILSATPEIMTDIKNRYYYPNNSMLVMAGDVDHQEAFAKVSSIFGDWEKAGFDIWQKYPIPNFEPIKYNQTYVTENPNAQIPIYMQGWHGPDTRSDIKATFAADVFSFILSQKNSKFQQALVESGLTYQAGVSYSTQKYTGPIYAMMVPNPAAAKDALQALQDQIAQWDSPNYFTDEQLQTAKEMLEIQEIYSREQTSQYIHTVTYWWASASLDYYTNYMNNLRSVTREDIINYVRKYIKNKPSIAGMLVSPQLRQGMNLDEYFTTTKPLEEYTLKVGGKNIAIFEEGSDESIQAVGNIMKMNPTKTVNVHVYAEKSHQVSNRIKDLRKKVAAMGIPEERLNFIPVIRKSKGLSQEELARQNTISFSF